jgi:hypothetical protein
LDTKTGALLVETDTPVSNGDNTFERPGGIGGECALHLKKRPGDEDIP